MTVEQQWNEYLSTLTLHDRRFIAESPAVQSYIRVGQFIMAAVTAERVLLDETVNDEYCSMDEEEER